MLRGRRALTRGNASEKRALSDRAARSEDDRTLGGISAAEVIAPMLVLLDAVGVSRRDVMATIRALPSTKLPIPVTVVRGQLEYWSELLNRWTLDPHFLGPDGRPRDLAFPGRNGGFSELVSLVFPFERPAVCRDILLATGAILRLPNGQLRLRRRAALAKGVDSGVILADEYLRPLRALLLALHTNLLGRVRKARPVVLQRAVSGFEISAEDMSELRGFISRHGSAFLETVDDWLSHRQKQQSTHQPKRSGTVRPYLGLYLSSEPPAAPRVPPTIRKSRVLRAVRAKRRQKARN
jgi:hypothetical protein